MTAYWSMIQLNFLWPHAEAHSSDQNLHFSNCSSASKFKQMQHLCQSHDLRPSPRPTSLSLWTPFKKKLLFGVCLQRLDYKHSLISPTYRKHLRYFNQGSLLSKASQLGKDRNGHMAQTAALIFCERKESYKPAACWVLGNYSYTALVCSRVN